MQRQTLVSLLVVGVLIVAGGSYALNRSPHIHQNIAETSGTIAGHVLDVEGQPVAEAQVYADRTDSPMGRRLPFVLTDKEGRFLIKGLASGTYTVSAAKENDGYAPTDSPFHSVNLTPPPQVTVYEQQTTSNVTLYLGPRATKLVGRVVDASTNKAIKNLQNVQITLRRMDYPDYSYSTGPDLDGEFNILVPSVPVTIEVSASGYEKRRLDALQLRQEEVKRLDISLRPVK